MKLVDAKNIAHPTFQQRRDVQFMNLCTCQCGRMNQSAVAVLSKQADRLDENEANRCLHHSGFDCGFCYDCGEYVEKYDW